LKLRHSTEEELHVRWISIDEITVRVAIREGTDGRIPLLLLNGIGAGFEMLLPFVDALPATRIIMFDAPGAGKSSAPTLPWRMRNYAKVCERVLDELGVPSANVMGVSWGGALAQQFARQYPQRCARLILAATSPGNIMIPGRLPVLWRMSNPRRYYDKNYMKRIAGTIYGGKLRTNRLSAGAIAELTTPPSKRGYYYQMMAIFGWTSLPWLRRLKQPTIVMHGNDDPIIPTVNARLMTSLIPGAKLMIVDCGHLFMLTRARRVAAVVKRFFEQLAALVGANRTHVAQL
jgi:poly(3-hydroxyalkanoate) depolymerase